jgi:hypothetical protein
MTSMPNTDSDKLAEDVINAYAEFDMHLHEKGPFPMFYFMAFFEAAFRYIESMKNSPMIHRNVASSINGLRDMLQLKSSRAPGKAIRDADRLECMLFSEYDPHFEGDEPLGL